MTQDSGKVVIAESYKYNNSLSLHSTTSQVPQEDSCCFSFVLILNMSSRLLWITLGLPAIVFSQSTSQTTSRPTDDCPILGPNFASDFNISQSNFTAKAIDEFPTIVEQLFESGQLLSNVTAFYIDVFSTQTKASIYNYAYSAELLKPALTAGLLDDSTIMRIGSVSKLFTVYTLLNAAGIDIFQDHVTDYLPELKGNTEPGKIKWDEITVGALASQQGGTGGFRKFPRLQCYYQPAKS